MFLLQLGTWTRNSFRNWVWPRNELWFLFYRNMYSTDLNKADWIKASGSYPKDKCKLCAVFWKTFSLCIILCPQRLVGVGLFCLSRLESKRWRFGLFGSLNRISTYLSVTVFLSAYHQRTSVSAYLPQRKGFIFLAPLWRQCLSVNFTFYFPHPSGLLTSAK